MTDSIKSWVEETRTLTAAGKSQGEYTVAAVTSLRRLPRALDALNKVLELHVPETEYGPDHFSGKYPCVECNMSDQEGLHPTLWPCPTVQAIEGAINHD